MLQSALNEGVSRRNNRTYHHKEYFSALTSPLPNVSAGSNGLNDNEPYRGFGSTSMHTEEPGIAVQEGPSILSVLYHEVSCGSFVSMPVESAGVWWFWNHLVVSQHVQRAPEGPWCER